MSAKSCTHIKVSDIRCGSPALRREQFCYSTSACSAPSLIPPPASTTPPSSKTRSPSRPPHGNRQLPAARHHRTQARRTHPPRPQHRRPQHPPPQVRRPQVRHAHRDTRTTPPRPSNQSTNNTPNSAAKKNAPNPPAPAKRPSPNTPPPSRTKQPQPAQQRQKQPQSMWGQPPRLSRRPRTTGPQRSAPEACPSRSSRSRNPQAPSKCESDSRNHKDSSRDTQVPSSGGAQECSPRRKPWVRVTTKESKPRRGERRGREL